MAGREDVGIGVRRPLARGSIGEMGPAAPLEGDRAEGLTLAKGVPPLVPGSTPAFLAGEEVTLDRDRIRRSHLRVSGGHPHGDYIALGRKRKWTCTAGEAHLTLGALVLEGGLGKIDHRWQSNTAREPKSSSLGILCRA